MSEQYKKYLAISIGLLFLVYGGVRLGVSSLLLLQIQGALATADLQAGIDEVIQFMTSMNEKALLPFSVMGYLIYLWFMGALLVIGAVGCLLQKRFAEMSLMIFLVLYVALFVNFQTINPKVFHLLACALLLVLYKYSIKTKINTVQPA